MEQKDILDFANKVNMEMINFVNVYNKTKDKEEKEQLLDKIKKRIDVLTPLKELEYKQRQLEALESVKNSDFAKNFNIKDMFEALKNMG